MTRRLIAVATLVALVAVTLSLESGLSRAEPDRPQVESASAAAPADALSSAWFCPMTFAFANEPERGEIAVTNFNDEAISATAEIYPAGSTSVRTQLNVLPNSRSTLRPGDVVDAELAGVLLQIDGGGVVVEHGVRTNEGESWAPCSTESSQTWHTADGSTDGGQLRLALFNPFDDYVVADVAASTDAGPADPIEYIGVVVPAQSLVVLDLGDQLRRRQWIATTVEARRGRLVVSQLQTGTLRDVDGAALSMATPATARSWTLPDGILTEGTTDSVAIYNPGDAEAEVDVQIKAEGREVLVLPTFVAPRSRAVSDLFLESGIPEGQRTAVQVIVTNGPGVVAQRTISGVDPASIRGYATAIGMRSAHTHWAVDGGTNDRRVWLFNPGDEPVRVDFDPGEEVSVEPGERATVVLDGDDSVAIAANGPITVSREFRYDPGLSISPAIPVRQ